MLADMLCGAIGCIGFSWVSVGGGAGVLGFPHGTCSQDSGSEQVAPPLWEERNLGLGRGALRGNLEFREAGAESVYIQKPVLHSSVFRGAWFEFKPQQRPWSFCSPSLGTCMSPKQNEGFLDHLQFEKHDCPGPMRSVLGYGCCPRTDPNPTEVPLPRAGDRPCLHTNPGASLYTMEYYSSVKKKNAVMPFTAMWMDVEIIILSEVRQADQDRHHMMSLIGGILKMVQTILFTKQN